MGGKMFLRLTRRKSLREILNKINKKRKEKYKTKSTERTYHSFSLKDVWR